MNYLELCEIKALSEETYVEISIEKLREQVHSSELWNVIHTQYKKSLNNVVDNYEELLLHYYPMENENMIDDNLVNEITDNVAKPIFVYFRPDWKKTYNPAIHDTLTNAYPWDLRFASTWSELGDVLKDNPSKLLVHVSMIEHSGTTVHEMMAMISTLTNLTIPGKTLPVAIAIDKTTSLATVKDCQKAGVFGLALSPNSWGVEDALHAAYALLNGIPYWPKHILSQLPGAPKPITKNSITLTNRQEQIMSLISKRGLSNKQIANALSIAESTVKIHVSAILKAYGVRTRTQLAVVGNK